MSTALLFVLIGLAMIVAHGLIVLTVQSLAVLAARAGTAGYRAWRRLLDQCTAGSNRRAGV